MLICTASVFLPFYLGTIPSGIALIYALAHRSTAAYTVTSPHSGWLYGFMGLGFVVGAIYGNWHGIAVLLLYLTAFMLAFYFQPLMSEKLHKHMLLVIATCSLPVALIAFLQKIPDFSYRSVSTFENANYYAYVCEIIVAMCVYALYRYKGRGLFYSIVIAVNLGAIYVSGCRTAWIGILVGIAVVMLCFKKYRHFACLLGAALIIGLGIVFVPQLIFPRLRQFGSDSHLRFLIWGTAVSMIKSHPLFGQGMFTYFVLSKGRPHDTHAHDIFLDILVNFGFVGFTIISVYAVKVLRALKRMLPLNPACALPFAVFAATLAHGFTDVPIMGFQTGELFLIMFAMAGVFGKFNGRFSDGNSKKIQS